MLYFAYASNLSKGYMLTRCSEAVPVKKVILKDYRLVFNELANIEEEVGSQVQGALYVISKEELDKLDRLEGYPDLYDRKIVEVLDQKGNTYDAVAYIMNDKKLELPPEHYYQILIKGYHDWNLPMEDLEKAREISK